MQPGLRVASGRAIVARVGVRMPRKAAQWSMWRNSTGSLGEVSNRFAMNRRAVRVYGLKKRWERVRGMQVAVPRSGRERIR